jgi:hypothetical protein
MSSVVNVLLLVNASPKFITSSLPIFSRIKVSIAELGLFKHVESPCQTSRDVVIADVNMEKIDCRVYGQCLPQTYYVIVVEEIGIETLNFGCRICEQVG